MVIEVSCRKCGKEYRVREERAGTKIRCKECQGTIVVPSAVADDEFVGEYGTDDAWGQREPRAVPARSRARTTSTMASAFTVRKLFGVLALMLAGVMCLGIVFQLLQGNARALGGFLAVAAVGGVGMKWLRS